MHIHILLQIEYQLQSLLSNLHSKVFFKERILVLRGLCSELALIAGGFDALSARLNAIVNRMNACADLEDERASIPAADIQVLVAEAIQALRQGSELKTLTLQQQLKAANIENFEIIDCGVNLVLSGSFDFSYYHNVEITFHEVQFIMCPGSIFSAEVLRLASEEEIQQLHTVMNGYERSGIVFCLEEHFGNHKYYVVAKQLDYVFETVYYYYRDHLQPGERLAEHVKRPEA